MRPAALALAALLLHAAPVAAAELGALWRGGLAYSDEMFKHPALEPVLRQLLGARYAEFRAATTVVVPVERHMGQVIVGSGCMQHGCGEAGAYVVADTRRGEVLVVLAPKGRPATNRFDRFATAGFPMPSESVTAALQRWQATYLGR
jgi:hypothetical protein